MSKLKEFVKNLPIIPSIYRKLRDKYHLYRLKLLSTESIFTEIYRNRKWYGRESVSGVGSDLNQTRKIIRELPGLFDKLKISGILDIPCGDFNWMQKIDLKKINYIGADIVKDLITENTRKYSKENISFQHLDLIEDKLPETQLIFCRDCLVHFCFEDSFRALENICDSKAEYLLTTVFIEQTENEDIATGQWRAINLETAPFNFPPPLEIIDEECTQDGGIYSDKALALWKISDIREILKKNRNTVKNFGV